MAMECEYIVFGREKAPTTGTPHLQGYVQRRNPTSFKTWQKLLFNAHISVPKGTPEQNRTYCTKEDSEFYERGVMPCPRQRTDLDEMFAAVVSGDARSSKDLMIMDITTYSRAHRVMDHALELFKPLDPAPEEVKDLRPWQQEVVALLAETPDNRTVRFYVDFVGGAGKTTLVRYLKSQMPRSELVCLKPCKVADMVHGLPSQPRVVIVDVPRSSMDFLQYSFLEDVKDGVLYSSKYQSHGVSFPSPHVLVFCNDLPDMSKLSQDRYVIVELSSRDVVCSSSACFVR